MEQTKNEPKNENKAAPDNGKPKKERKPLTEAQRLKRQKMIVLPAIVLVFIGAMWLIFAPSSDKEQQPGTGGYNIEMPDREGPQHIPLNASIAKKLHRIQHYSCRYGNGEAGLHSHRSESIVKFPHAHYSYEKAGGKKYISSQQQDHQ